jgi:Zn-dependent protease with chaperone function
MRRIVWSLLGLALAASAPAHDIEGVLLRSQQVRLQTLPLAEPGPRADLVRQSFERLRRSLGLQAEVELRVVTGPVLAEAMLGSLIVANETLADAPEGARLFILAHELGHIAANDWSAMNRLYVRWIPDEVVPEKTDPVAGPMGREASALSHQQELAADAFALRSLRRLGWSTADAIAAFMAMGQAHTYDTATHPSTRKRLANLRMVPTETQSAGLSD